MVTDADRQIACTLIKKMWVENSHFSICTYDKCLLLLELPRPVEYSQLLKYHCVNFCDMPPGFPDTLLGVVLSTLTRVTVGELIDNAFRAGAEKNANFMLSAIAEGPGKK